MPSPDYGGMPKATGRERTNLLSKMKAAMVRGCTPTCTGRKAIRGNAAYWYSRASEPVCLESLEAEWLSIVRALLR